MADETIERPTILVIDDDPLMRKLVRVTLQSEGYSVAEAGDGRTALEILVTFRPSLVLQDLVLPDVDGLELAAQIRALPQCAELPILALSGLLSKMDRTRNGEGAFTDHIVKPVEPSRLLGIVRQYLGQGGPGQAGPGRGRWVLLADDDPLQRKLLRLHLEHAGFKVVTAEDGVEALEQARLSPPDAVVSDMLMPRMDGLKLCLAVRKDPRLSHIPVVLMSAAFIEEADRRLAEGAGTSAFVARTPDYRNVIDTLLAALDSEALPAPAPELPDEEYADRVAHQLEVQAELSSGLAQRLAWLESRLSIIVGFTEALKRSTATEPLLDEVLYRALEATRADRGAAYLVAPDGSLVLRAGLGYYGGGARLSEFFGHQEMLRRVLESGMPLDVPSAQVPRAEGLDLLRRAGVKQMLLVPLASQGERLGMLAIAWNKEDREEDWRSVAMAICGQVSQAVALGLALARQRESEDRFRRLAENSQDVIYRLSLRPRPVYEYVSPAVRAIVGYSPEEFYADPDLPLRLIHPDDRPRFEAAVAGSGPTEPLLLRFRHRDGHIVWLESRYTLVRDRSGEIVAMEGVARDITERKAAEAERERLLEAEQEARRQAEAATKARGEFMSIAAHELKTPVTSLQGYAQVTLREIEKSGSVNPTRLAKSMRQIDAQGKRLTTLIERLLDLSRLEAGKLVLTRQEVNLSAVVENLINAIRHSHPGREIELHCGQTVCASVDSSRLEQIVTNLIDNALKFSQPESAVEVEVALDGPGWIRIAVRDHGIGIPEDKRSHVFEQFFQVHGRRQYGGMGIGLYVSRQIAEMHGGTIHHETPEGGGSRFVVRLPIHQCDGTDGANSSLA